jgi:ecotropic viral integration site 5 protein
LKEYRGNINLPKARKMKSIGV